MSLNVCISWSNTHLFLLFFLWSNQRAQKLVLLFLHWLLLLSIILISVMHVGEGALQQQIHIRGWGDDLWLCIWFQLALGTLEDQGSWREERAETTKTKRRQMISGSRKQGWDTKIIFLSAGLQLLTQTGWRKTPPSLHPLFLCLNPQIVPPVSPGPVQGSPGFGGPDRWERLGRSEEFHFLRHYSCHPGPQTWNLSSCSQIDGSHCYCLKTERIKKHSEYLPVCLSLSLSSCLSFSLNVSLPCLLLFFFFTLMAFTTSSCCISPWPRGAL